MSDIYRQGRCVESGRHELFFSAEPAELSAAQRLCEECVVRVSCLAEALENAYEWGVWGGVIFWDGQAFYRRRGRGRPRHGEAHLPVEASHADLQELVRCSA